MRLTPRWATCCAICDPPPPAPRTVTVAEDSHERPPPRKLMRDEAFMPSSRSVRARREPRPRASPRGHRRARGLRLPRCGSSPSRRIGAVVMPAESIAMMLRFVFSSTALKRGTPAPPCECTKNTPAFFTIAAFAASTTHVVSKFAPAKPSRYACIGKGIAPMATTVSSCSSEAKRTCSSINGSGNARVGSVAVRSACMIERGTWRRTPAVSARCVPPVPVADDGTGGKSHRNSRASRLTPQRLHRDVDARGYLR